MNEALKVLLATLSGAVAQGAIPDTCKRSVAWCLEQLPNLYAQFQGTSESRYFDEINRLVRGMIKELTTDKKVSPEGQQLAGQITEQFRVLHEELGMPALSLKPIVVKPLRTRKAG